MEKKAIVGVAIAALLLLSMSVQANNISLGSSMGIHHFSITDEKQMLISDGFFSVRNTKEYAAEIEISVQIKLLDSEFDNDGNPRTHKVTNHVLYKEMQTANWILIDTPSFVVQSDSSQRVSYSVKIPARDIIDDIENGTYGYLCYIRISEITEQEGSNVGVGYLYKVFVHFDDNIAYSSSSLGFILTPFLVLSMLISIILFFYIIQKKKNYVKFATMLKRKNTSPVKTAKNKNEVKNVVVRKTKTTSNKNEVKNILARKTQHDNTHRIRYTRGGH